MGGHRILQSRRLSYPINDRNNGDQKQASFASGFLRYACFDLWLAQDAGLGRRRPQLRAYAQSSFGSRANQSSLAYVNTALMLRNT